MKYYITQTGVKLIKEYMGPVEKGVAVWDKTLQKNPDSQQQRSTAQRRGSQAQAKRKRDIDKLPRARVRKRQTRSKKKIAKK